MKKTLWYIFVGLLGFAFPVLAQFSDRLLSTDLAPSPSNGKCLTTNGTDNVWSTCTSGGSSSGDSTLFTLNGNTIDTDGVSTTPTTTIKTAGIVATSTTVNSNFVGFTATRSTTSAATTTNFFSSILTATTGFFTNLFGTNATITAATTTNLNTTNLKVSTLSGLLKGTSGLVSTASNGTDYTLITGTTCGGTDKVSAVLADGTVTCSADQTGGTGGTQDWLKTTDLLQIYPTSTVGLLIQNATSSFATTSISRLLLGYATNTKQSVGGGGPETISNSRASGNDLFIWSGLPGDVEGRFLVETNGFFGWGAGGTSDQDIHLFRNGVGSLGVQSFNNDSTAAFFVNDKDSNTIFNVDTVSNYISTPQILVNGAGGGAKLDVYGAGSTAIRAEQTAASDVSFATYVTGDAQLRFSFLADGTQKWGSGSAVGDVTLSRAAANQLSILGVTGEAKLGVGSSSPSAVLSAQGYAGSLTPILSVSSSTNATYLKVDAYGTTTISGATAATSSTFIYSSASGKGGAIILEDSNGSTCTQITTLAGVVSGTAVTCPPQP